MSECVTCRFCGYLAVRHLETPLLVSPIESQRKSGLAPSSNKTTVNVDMTPICAVGAFDLATEMDAPTPVGFVRVVKRERQCSRHTTWMPGLNPAEHVKMNVLDRQQAWMEAQDASNRRWRVIELVVMGGIVTLVSVAAQIVAAYIQRDPPAAPAQPQLAAPAEP